MTGMATYGVPDEQATFSDGTVADQQHFEQVVAIGRGEGAGVTYCCSVSLPIIMRNSSN